MSFDENQTQSLDKFDYLLTWWEDYEFVFHISVKYRIILVKCSLTDAKLNKTNYKE